MVFIFSLSAIIDWYYGIWENPQAINKQGEARILIKDGLCRGAKWRWKVCVFFETRLNRLERRPSFFSASQNRHPSRTKGEREREKRKMCGGA